MIQKFALFLGVVTCAVPVQAQPASEFAAMIVVLRGPIAKELGTGTFKRESAKIFGKPFLPDDTIWEKKARTEWYGAQLPAAFSLTGTVSVLYLRRCMPELPGEDLIAGDERGNPDVMRAADAAYIRNALETKGIAGIALDSLQGRTEWARQTPDPGLRVINTALRERFSSGSLTERIAIFEPFCPSSQRGSYEHAKERYEKMVAHWSALDGPVPPPPLLPPPPPSPPPPPQISSEPIGFKRPPGAKIFLISELRSWVCRELTGSHYNPSCPGWQAVLGGSMTLNGRRYRYRVEPAAGKLRVGTIDLNLQPSPIDLTQ